jgi:hypothetical protein
MPEWNGSIMQAPSGPDWLASLPPDSAAKVLNDDALGAAVRNAREGARVFKSDVSVLRLDPEKGRFGYHSRARETTSDEALRGVELPPNAAALAMEALKGLGLPASELAGVSSITQSAATGEAGKPASFKGDLYQIVEVSRTVNKLPVLGSDARVAINAKGEVQRARIAWPAFELDRGDGLLSRAEVSRNAVAFMLDQGVRANVTMKARLGYAPLSPEGRSKMLPVLILSINDGPTPMLLTAPLVAPPSEDDESSD